MASYVVRAELRVGTFAEWNPRDCHALTHLGNGPRNLEDLTRADEYDMRHRACFLSRPESIREGDRLLLDQSLLGLGGGMGMGHSRDRLPTMFSGGRGPGIRQQGHLKLPPNTPLANGWRTLLERFGVRISDGFQDSTGIVQELVS